MKTKAKRCLLLIVTVLLWSMTAACAEVSFSARVDALMSADRMLRIKYDITPEMLDFFDREVEKTNEGCYLIRYTGTSDWGWVLGTYEVTAEGEKVTGVTWSHDGEDISRGFDSDFWGAEQITEMLCVFQTGETDTKDYIEDRLLEIDQKYGIEFEYEEVLPDNPWNCQEIRAQSLLTGDEMREIAREAVMQIFELPDELYACVTAYSPDSEAYYCMTDGEPCYEVILGRDSDDGSAEWTYWILVNTQTGVIEDFSYVTGVGGNG